MTNEPAERLFFAFSPQWTIETGRVENPDGTVTIEGVTVKATVEAMLAAERKATVERIRAAIDADSMWSEKDYARANVILDAEAER